MPDISFDWGIDRTSTSEGQQELDDILFGEGSATGDPDEISNADEQTTPDKTKTKTSKPVKEKVTTKEVSNETDVLGLGEDEDEETEENDDEEVGEVEQVVKPKKVKTPKKTKNEEVSEEDEEEDNEDDSEETEDGDGDDDSEQPNTFQNLTSELTKLGVFEDDDELPVPENGQQFLERFQIESRKQAQLALDSYLGRFGEDRLKLFDAVYNKGVDIHSYLKTFDKIEQYSGLDLTKEVNQEKVVRASLSNQGFDPEDIDTEIERLKEYGDLETVSQKYHKVLVKQEEKKLEQEATQAQQKLQAEEQYEQHYANSVASILNEGLKQKNLDGLALTPAVAQKVNNFLTVKPYKLPSGELLTEFDKFFLELKKPENFPLKVKVALLALNGFDLSKISTKKASQQNSELFDTLARQQKKTSFKNPTKKKKESEDFFSSWQ